MSGVGASPRRGRGGTDPLGTRALFSPPAGDVAPNDPFAPAVTGRRALFDEGGSRGGVATLRCGGCGRRTRLGWRALGRALVPSLWVPGHRPDRYLRCPACGRRTWGELELG